MNKTKTDMFDVIAVGGRRDYDDGEIKYNASMLQEDLEESIMDHPGYHVKEIKTLTMEEFNKGNNMYDTTKYMKYYLIIHYVKD